MAGLTDEEVFGTSAPQTGAVKSQSLSDEEVFGASAAPVAKARSFSDAEVGLGPNTNERPGITDYLGEVGKQVAHGGVDALITSRLRGIAGQIYQPDTSVSIPTPPVGGYKTEAEVPELPILPVTQSTPYKAAESVEGFMKSTLPDKNILNPVVRDVSGGVGSVVGNVAGMLIPGTRGFGITSTPLTGAGESVERAVKADATEDQIRRAASFGNIAGVTEFGDAALAFLGTPGKVTGMIAKVGLRAMQGAFIEGGTEGLQQFIQNAIAKGVYKPKQDLSEDVAYNAMIGAIVGGGVSAATTRRGAPEATPVTDETLNAAVGAPAEDPGIFPTKATAPGPPPVSGEASLDSLMPVEPPPSPTLSEMKADNIPPEVVDFINKEAPKLSVPENPQQLSLDNLFGPQKEEVQSTPGANVGRLAKLLGQNLYGDLSTTSSVTVKELFQNAFDGIKTMIQRGDTTPGNIDITMDRDTRTIVVHDDGSGMTPQVLGKQFLEIAGTNKESERSSGGFGIAKMQFLFGNKSIKVTSLRDSKVSTLISSGAELFGALDGKTKGPTIQVRNMTEKDRAAFPKGHGTRVEVVVPKTFVDTNTGETKEISFHSRARFHPVLNNSPLFNDINVKFNGENLPSGMNFPVENYTAFSNVNFDWGTARIYIEKAPNENMSYSPNAHVLSNGIWQFSSEIKAYPSQSYGKNIPFNVYIDVDSKVRPEDAGYPFELNRQRFSTATQKGFANIFNYIGMIYQEAELQSSAQNFGSMQFLSYDPVAKGVKASPAVSVTPKMPAATENPFGDTLRRIKNGKSFKIVDGTLVVDGFKVPELKPQDVAQYKINTDDLIIDQSEIDPDKVILHDNTVIHVSNVEERTVTEYGRERFGKRFDEYVFGMGDLFRQLRDIVVKSMPGEEALAAQDGWGLEPSMANSMKQTNNGYEALAKEGVGISFDQEYRGVSIRVPFSASFINPFVPVMTDTVRAAVLMVGTMVHELAHHNVRNHNAEFPAEMQKILAVLDTTEGFDFNAFKQKAVNIVAAYNDVFNHMNGVFTSGNFDLSSRGKRFKDTGSDEARNGGALGAVARFGSESEAGSQLSYWVAASETVTPEGERRAGASYESRGSGGTRPSDNGRSRNYAATRSIDPGITAPPQQPEVSALYESVKKVPGGETPEVKEAASHAHRMNWLYKWTAGLTELLDANPMFQPLIKYVERIRAMHNDETKVHDAALRIMRDWRDLGDQAIVLENFIRDLQTMPYLNKFQRELNMWRNPTPDELKALFAKHKMSDAAAQLYVRIRDMGDIFLTLLEQEAVEHAQRTIPDPIKLADRIDELKAHGRLARSQPFFPFTRFGRHYVMVKDKAGSIIHFETFEPARLGFISVKSAERYQMKKLAELKKKLLPGQEAIPGILPETAGPLLGLPTLLHQRMLGEDIGLTDDQIAAMRLMQSMRNPALALKQRSMFLPPAVPGFSDDLQRSFAKYYFHGGRYYAKVRHAWALHGHIATARIVPGNKANLIASYMADHLRNTVMDASGDFGFFRGAIFLWAMGYVPAAATQNLTQTPMITLPFLSAKFGDLKAPAAIVKAMSQVSSFYRKGAYDKSTAFEMQAIEYGIKTGRISETQAPELAGLSIANNLLSGQGGNKLQRGAIAFQEKAAFMFEMAEQFNRRVAFRAALNLAMNNPNAKFVEESVQKHPDEYKALLAKEFLNNEAGARAVITAINATDSTQYVYARYSRPRFMRGPLGATLFVFKRYIQATLYMLGHNKSDVLPRFMIMALLMGGLGGVPGYEDVVGLFRALAKWFFGKDVSVDRLVRQYMNMYLGKDSPVQPDLILHGLSRYGFGLPALMDLMGSVVTGNPARGLHNAPGGTVPAPVFDRSRALSMGNILPLNFGKLIEPVDKQDKVMNDQLQQASGAVFSVGFNLYKSIMASYQGDMDRKEWERSMPRALSSASRSYRALSEGRERGRGGPNSAPTIIPYNAWGEGRQTEHLMEAIGLAGGYQPLRLQMKWDSIIAKAEVTAFYDFKRKGLLEQFFEARKGGNKEEIEKMASELRRYNKELPEYARGKTITDDTIKRSMAGRERALQAKEAGVPVQKANIGISKHIDSLFPESTVDVRRVK